jgi:hypothetical protein
MTLRIEFTKVRSPRWARVLSIVRKLPTFKETTENGETVYSVDFDTSTEFETAQAVLDFVRGWQSTALYMDGKLVPTFHAVRFIGDKMIRAYRIREREEMKAEQRERVEKTLEARRRLREAHGVRDILGGDPPVELDE